MAGSDKESNMFAEEMDAIANMVDEDTVNQVCYWLFIIYLASHKKDLSDIYNTSANICSEMIIYQDDT